MLVNYKTGTTAAEDVCHAIAAAGGVAIPAQADVSDRDAVARAAEMGREAFGRSVDILVNCAGGAVTPRPFLETGWDDVQQVLDVHLRGAYNCCQAVVPGMVAAEVRPHREYRIDPHLERAARAVDAPS